MCHFCGERGMHYTDILGTSACKFVHSTDVFDIGSDHPLWSGPHGWGPHQGGWSDIYMARAILTDDLWRGVCPANWLSAYHSLSSLFRLSVCLSVCLFVCLPICLSAVVCLSDRDSVCHLCFLSCTNMHVHESVYPHQILKNVSRFQNVLVVGSIIYSAHINLLQNLILQAKHQAGNEGRNYEQENNESQASVCIAF